MPVVLVTTQGLIQQGQGQLAATQGAVEGIFPQPLNPFALTYSDARLGSTEKFVPAEGGNIGAGLQNIGHGRFIGSWSGGAAQQTSRSQIDQQRQPFAPGQPGQLRRGDGAGKAGHPIVTGMDIEQGGGIGPYGGLVVGQMGAVGGAHLHHSGAGLGNDVGHAEGAADLHLLAPADNNLPPLGHTVEHQQHRGGIVVDRQGRLAAGKGLERSLDQIEALAPAAGIQIELQVGVALQRGQTGGQEFRPQRRPAESCVEHHACAVYNGPQGGASQDLHTFANAPADLVCNVIDRNAPAPVAGLDLATHCGQGLADNRQYLGSA